MVELKPSGHVRVHGKETGTPKTAYPDISDALIFAAAHHKSRAVPYRCGLCGQYHLTTQKRNRRAWRKDHASVPDLMRILQP